MRAYMVHVFFFWHWGYHSDHSTMPTISPHPTVNLVLCWNHLRPQSHYVCNNMPAIAACNAIKPVSGSTIIPYLLFPEMIPTLVILSPSPFSQQLQSPTIHSYRHQLTYGVATSPPFSSSIAFIVVRPPKRSSLFSLCHLVFTIELNKMYHTPLRYNYCTLRQRFPGWFLFWFALDFKIVHLTIINSFRFWELTGVDWVACVRSYKIHLDTFTECLPQSASDFLATFDGVSFFRSTFLQLGNISYTAI